METGQAMSTPSMNANYTLKRERAQRNRCVPQPEERV